MCGGPQEYIAYGLVLASSAVSRVSGSSNLYSFRDGGQVSVQLESRGVLSPGLVQCCSQRSCVVTVKLFLARSKLCSSVSAWLGVFASNAMSVIVFVG